jgi:hypothetical protein
MDMMANGTWLIHPERDESWPCPECNRNIVFLPNESGKNTLGGFKKCPHCKHQQQFITPLGVERDKEDNRERQRRFRLNKGHISCGQKKCTRCQQIKSITDFSKDATKPGGIRAHCKSCVNKYNSRRRGEEDIKSSNNNDTEYEKITTQANELLDEFRRQINRDYKEAQRAKDLESEVILLKQQIRKQSETIIEVLSAGRARV